MIGYNFYIEYDGKRTVTQDYRRPDNTIFGETITDVGERFAKRKKMKFVSYDVLLSNKSYRLYFENKKHEMICFVV